MSRRSKKEHSYPEPVDSLVAIIKANFSYRGRLDCKFLWSEGGVSRYRLNWYTKTWEASFITEYISNSKFIRVYDDGRIFVVKGTHTEQIKT